MNEQQFKQALQELHDSNQLAQYSREQLEDIQHQLSYILQSYLWEGYLIKTLNNPVYWSLAKSWHPDKFIDGSSQDYFANWYMKINAHDQSSLFKVLSVVKEAYRPGLLLAKHSLLADGLYNVVKPSLSKVANFLYKMPERVVKAVVTPVEPVVVKLVIESAVVEPIALPYWKVKFDKYMSKDNEKISDKRINLKKQRNAILDNMGINEGHVFRETLDELISQKSADYDKSGFVKDDASEKRFPILEVLNLKTQVLFLNNALQKKSYLPHSKFIPQYPKELDYHKLVAKNTLG